jgi:beta-N-acetylhexosaminidase
LSLQAGCDLALQCNGDPADMLAVAGAAPQMSTAAQSRARAALACLRPPADVDFAALAAECSAIIGANAHE